MRVRARLVPLAATDTRRAFLSYLLHQPGFKEVALVRADEVEVAEELMPRLRAIAASFGLEVHEAGDG